MEEFSALAATVKWLEGARGEALGAQPGGSLDNGGALEMQRWVLREIF